MAVRKSVTINDVAEKAGFSPMTISAVLSGKAAERRISVATQTRVRAVADELGYKTNHLARSLATGRSGALGLVFPYSSAYINYDPLSMAILSGVMTAAVEARWNLMLHTATGDDWNAVDSRDLIDPRVDGLLLVIPTPHSPVVARSQYERFPCVSVMYAPETADICCVNADDYAGGRLATEHLIGLGHRRIAHLEGASRVSTTVPRRDGYLAALRDSAIPADPTLMVSGEFTTPGGYQAMKKILCLAESRWPTAVFAANDLSARGAIMAMTEHGIRIPNDMAIVGYDDSKDADRIQPPLTSVRMPIYEMSYLATEMLIALIEGKEIVERQPVFPVSLTVRHSCGASSVAR